MGEFSYGTDTTERFDTIAQAERLPDGTIHYEVVILDRATNKDAVR